MKVMFALLAEAINRTETGTINILGEFNTLYSPTFPVVRPSMGGFIRLQSEKGDPESIELRVDIVSDDGEATLWEIEPITIAVGTTERADVVLSAVGVVFPSPGKYRLRAILDGVEAYSHELKIGEPPAAPTGV